MHTMKVICSMMDLMHGNSNYHFLFWFHFRKKNNIIFAFLSILVTHVAEICSQGRLALIYSVKVQFRELELCKEIDGIN